jgi:hypothetical protein
VPAGTQAGYSRQEVHPSLLSQGTQTAEKETMACVWMLFCPVLALYQGRNPGLFAQQQNASGTPLVLTLCQTPTCACTCGRQGGHRDAACCVAGAHE